MYDMYIQNVLILPLNKLFKVVSDSYNINWRIRYAELR